MLYVLYTYYNRANDLSIEVSLEDNLICELQNEAGPFVELPCGRGRLQCSVVQGQHSFPQNPRDLLDANATSFGGGCRAFRMGASPWY